MNDRQAIASQLFTIRDLIRYGITQFVEAELVFGHGTDNALDEATQLVLHSLRLPHDLPGHFVDSNLLLIEKSSILDLFERRITERKPAAYLTNVAWFAGLKFYVDERVLVPRSPIAELINKHFSPWVNYSDVGKILDLATGSGCIAIACAYAFPEAEVDAIDISKDALDVARRNVADHSLEEQVKLIQSDLFSNLGGEKYDLIVTNPPYVEENEIEELAPEYRHEPKIGLVSGQHGLDAILTILRQASSYMTQNGVLFAEVGATRYTLEDEFPEVPFTWIEFENGGDGVFMMSREQLVEFEKYFKSYLRT